MLKRKFQFLLLTLCLFSGSHAFSQVSKLEWGPDAEAQKRLYPNRFIGKDERAIYFIKDTYNPFCPFCPTDHYLEKSKHRYKIEAKNSELKNVHGYGRAIAYGITNMQMQGAMAIFTVNLKRIIKLM